VPKQRRIERAASHAFVFGSLSLDQITAVTRGTPAAVRELQQQQHERYQADRAAAQQSVAERITQRGASAA